MHDLAIIVPSRGRPQSITRLIDACSETCETDWTLCWGFDDDDPALEESRIRAKHCERSLIWTGPRRGLGPWTNTMWEETRGRYRYFASLGDDHVPITPGWDKQLMATLEANGGGFAYCYNGQNPPDLQNYPEMCVVSAPILDALGWFCEPTLEHYCVDIVWRDLGLATDSLYYHPDITIDHRHHVFNRGQWAQPWEGRRDATYFEELNSTDPARFAAWEAERRDIDAATVAAALARMRGLSPRFALECSRNAG